MGNTTKSSIEFINRYPSNSNARHFAARLLNETRIQGEATEANIACVAEQCGVGEREREEVIGAALDHGLVRSTQLETSLCAVAGLRSVACLART